MELHLLDYSLNNSINIQRPTKHTHFATNGTSNVLDICLIKNYPGRIEVQTISELTSDDLPVYINIGGNTPQTDFINKSFTNWPHFRHIMHTSTIQYAPIKTIEELEDTTQKLTTEILQEEGTARVTTTIPTYSETRLPAHIKELIKEKNRLLRRARSTKSRQTRKTKYSAKLF